MKGLLDVGQETSSVRKMFERTFCNDMECKIIDEIGFSLSSTF